MGLQLASSAELASALQAVLESTSFGDGGEELVLNAVCAMTNLSFYQRPENKAGGRSCGAALSVLLQWALGTGCTTHDDGHSIRYHKFKHPPCGLKTHVYDSPFQVLAMGASTLLKHVTPLLLCDNEEAIVEAARAFGNFSRTADARAYMVGARVLEALVLLLDHSSTEVLYR